MISRKILTVFLFIFLFACFSFEALANGLNSNSTLPANKQKKVSKEIEKLRNLRRSQINISKNNFSVRIKVFLFAENEKIEILDGSYCGGEEGAKQYTGNYQLISVKDNKIVSKIDLGKDYEFIEDTLHSGLQLFVMPQIYEQLIMIYQYESCNIERVEFYRVDVEGRIYKVNFIDKDGTVGTGQSTSPAGDIPQSDGSVIFCSYDNSIGHMLCDSYIYNGKNFIQTSSWMTQEGKRTSIAEARRALYEYLDALWWREYKKADYKKTVYYYGGGYDFLLQLNPDVSPNDKPKLFELYCTKNGGNCLKPSYFSDKNLESTTTEAKFTVEFITEERADFKINGHSDFEFRVRRIDNEFKVLDLPPRTSQK